MNIRKMKRMAVSLLLIISITGGLLSPAVNVSAAVSDTVANNSSTEKSDKSKSEMLYGGLYDMGYEFEIEPKLMTGTVLKVRAVCEEDKTIVETQTSTGYYELELTEGRKYHVTFWAYISGRLKNLNCHMDDVVCGTEINFVVRTKTVPGLAELNKYRDKIPDNPLIVRGEISDNPSATLSYDKWQETELKLSTDTLSFDISPKRKFTQQYIKPETKLEDKTYTYESGYTFTSSNKAVAEVDENGCVTAVAKGNGKIICTIETAQKSAVCKADVRGGFDYSKDGYCFANAQYAFYYDDYNYRDDVTTYYPYERFTDVYGNTYTGNNNDLKQLISHTSLRYKQVWEEERKFGGNCFGMSLSSILFYNCLLNVDDYKTEKYDDGDTVNMGLYDCFVEKKKTDKNENDYYYAALNKDSELTKMIERYQIWQNWNWKFNKAISFEEILENWDSGKTYLLRFNHDSAECSREGCGGDDFGHAVVVDTHGAKPEPNKNGDYELPIYDPNCPAFTDDMILDGKGVMVENTEEQAYITVNVSDSILYTGQYVSPKTTADVDKSEENMNKTKPHALKYLLFMDVNSAPVEFKGQYDYIELQDDSYTVKALGSDSIIVKGKEKDTIYLIANNGKVSYLHPSILICNKTNGENGDIQYSMYPIEEDVEMKNTDSSSNKKSSESPAVTAVNWVSDGAVQAASFDGAGTISMTPNNEMQIHTESKSTVNLLTEKHASDGSIVSVAGELQSGAGNDITCTLDENNQFLLQSSEKTEAILTLNTEETGFEQKAVISVDGNSEKVDILDYMEKNKTDNPTISGPESSEGKEDDENNSSGTNSPKKGTLVTDKATKAVYKITGINNNKRTVQYIKPVGRQIKSAKIPAYITYKGMKYNVTSIASNAFKGNKKLKKVTIGKNVLTIGNKAFYKCTALTKITIPVNVQKIGKQAFYGDKTLKLITIKTKKLTAKKVGSQAFKGVSNKAVIRAPKNKLKSYKKLLKTKGIGKKVTFKKQ